VFGYFDALDEKTDPQVMWLDHRSWRKQNGTFVDGQRTDDSVFVFDSEKTHPLFKGVLPGGRHLLQEAKLEIRPSRNGPLPTLDGGAHGPAREKF
jgi:hypothetical protein